MYKNIIFDMGNVLLKFSPHKYIKNLNLQNENEEKMLFNAVYNTMKCQYLDKGVYTEEDFINEVSKELPDKFRAMVEKLILTWYENIEPVEGMAELVKTLKDKGYKIYLLSNAGYKQHTYWENVPGSEYFDGKIVSCDYNCIKPEKEIYKALFDKFNLNPSECFFIDDLTINIYGANECGMKGFVFNGDAEELKKEFIKQGIL